MSDQRLSDKSALSAAPADGDLIHIVDVSDTSQNAAGSSKKITYANLVSLLVTAAAFNSHDNTKHSTDLVGEAGVIAALSEKTVPIGDDLVVIEDSAASNAVKKVKLSTLAKASKAFTIEEPSATEDKTLFYTDKAIKVSRLIGVLTGSDTPSVTYTIRFAADRSATGTELVTAGSTVTSTTTGDADTSFDEDDIPADNWVWLETTAQSGTVTDMSVTITYTWQ